MCNGTRLPTTMCVMVPVKLQGKKPSKNTAQDYHNILQGQASSPFLIVKKSIQQHPRYKPHWILVHFKLKVLLEEALCTYID
jgi:hypothetical protein